MGSKIYGFRSSKEPTMYQQKVNEASFHLAMKDPSLLSSRQTLLERAREMVNESGYNFKKGKSRSKKLQDSDSEQSSKHCKTSEALRTKRISQLNDDIKDFNDRLQFKEKRRQQATNSRNYKLCDQLTEEMSEIKQKKRECEHEVEIWKQKQRKSSWYKKKKGISSLSNSPNEVATESDASSQPRRKKFKQSNIKISTKQSHLKTGKRPALFDFNVSSESSCNENEISDSEASADVSSLASTPQTHNPKPAALPTLVDLTCNEDNMSIQTKSFSSNNSTASLSPLPSTTSSSSSLPSVLPSSSQSEILQCSSHSEVLPSSSHSEVLPCSSHSEVLPSSSQSSVLPSSSQSLSSLSLSTQQLDFQ